MTPPTAAPPRCVRTTVYDLANDGEIVKVHIGRRAFITTESLVAYVDRLTEKATVAAV